jgi:hypothetical protein
MQVDLDDIGGGECLLWQSGEEEFVDHACTCDANRTLLFPGGMGRHHHATQHTLRSHRHFRAVVETADDLTFRTLLGLVGGQLQACLDERVIEYAVVFAAGNVGEASQVGEHRSGAILAKDMQQGACQGQVVRREVARDGRQALAQLLSVATIASIAKRAEPTFSYELG